MIDSDQQVVLIGYETDIPIKTIIYQSAKVKLKIKSYGANKIIAAYRFHSNILRGLKHSFRRNKCDKQA